MKNGVKSFTFPRDHRSKYSYLKTKEDLKPPIGASKYCLSSTRSVKLEREKGTRIISASCPFPFPSSYITLLIFAPILLLVRDLLYVSVTYHVDKLKEHF